MKTFFFALLMGSVLSTGSFAQAWRPKPPQRTTTTTTTRVYTAPSTSTRTVRVHHSKRTGVANARAHGGVAHAYGHTKHTTTVVKVHHDQ